MTILNLKDFMKKTNWKVDTVTEGDLHKFYNYSLYRRHSILYAKKGFIEIDNGQIGGTFGFIFS